MADDIVLSPHDAPNIRTPAAMDTWTAAELCKAVASVSPLTLERRANVAYLTSLLELADPNGGFAVDLTPSLKSVVRAVILDRGARSLTQNAEAVRRLLYRTIPGSILYLPEGASHPEVIRSLAGCETRVLILPATLCPENARAGVELGESDGYALLDQIDHLVRGESEELADAASRAAEAIFRALATRRGLVQEIASFKVFRARDEVVGRRVPVSWNELDDARNRRVLFAQPVTDRLLRLLQQALPEGRVLTLAPGPFWGELGFDIGPCTREACLDAVWASPVLAASEVRAGLVVVVMDADTRRHRAAIRYLLHGEAAARDDGASLLFSLDSPELEPLARRLYEAAGEAWQLLSAAMTERLPPAVSGALGVRRLSIGDIINRLSRYPATSFDGIVLSDKGRLELLREIEDADLWRRLPFHRLTSGRFGAIAADCFLESGHPVPPQLTNVVTLVRLSPDLAVLRQQKEWVERWGPRAILAMASRQSEPHRFAEVILDALSDLGQEVDLEAEEETIRALRSSPWATTGARALPPLDVLDLPPDLVRALNEAMGDLRREEIPIVEDLNAEILDHRALPLVKKLLCCGGDGAARRLGELLVSLGGLAALPNDAALTDADALVSRGTALPLPGWPVLAAALGCFSRETIERYLLRGLLGELSDEQYLTSLTTLAEVHQRGGGADASTLALYRHFLDAALHCGMTTLLPRLTMPNRLGEWVDAGSLCAAAIGVEDRYLIHSELAPLFHPQGSERPLSRSSGTDPLHIVVDAAMLAAAPSVVRGYFAGWRNLAPMAPAGAFVALLGDTPDWRELARELLAESNRTLDVVRGAIEQSRHANALTSWKIADIVSRQHFAIRVVTGETVELTSIAGTPFRARLRSAYDTLLVGEIGQSVLLPDGRYGRWLALRALDPSAHGREKLLQLLRAAFDFILAEIYLIKNTATPAIEELWEKVSDGGQVDIQAARHAAIEGLEHLLPTFGVHDYLPLKDALNAVFAARRSMVEAGTGPQAEIRKADYGNARDRLQQIVEHDEEAQRAILRAVRRKMADSEYRPWRVAFELFQNADDAATELLEGIGETTVPAATRVLVDVSSQALTFVHWGRPINDTLGDAERASRFGHAADLEKMLVLGFSDKFDDERLTGKFGLGFKSVYLVTDRPEIASKWLRCEIVGGLLPKHCDSDRIEAFFDAHAREGTPPTVFRMPARIDGTCSPPDVVDEFRACLGVMLAFSHSIRSARMTEAGGEISVHWHPTIVPGIEAAEVGEIRVPGDTDQPESAQALKLNAGNISILLRLGPFGIEALTERLPTVWCVAPTHESWNIGYAINGDFRIDVGRSRLSGDDTENLQKLENAGNHLGEILLQLYNVSLTDWLALAAALGLAGDETVGFRHLWTSLFLRLSDGLNDGATGARLLKALHGRGRGIARLVESEAALPRGLPRPLDGLVNARRTLRVVSGMLAQAEVLAAATEWPGAAGWRYEAISEAIGDRLVQLGFPRLSPLRLAQVLSLAIGVGKKVDPALADGLGIVLTQPVFHQLGMHEHSEVREVLIGCHFRSGDGSFQPARVLYQRVDDGDLSLRAAFAPEDRVLSDAYGVRARQFFELARSFSGFVPSLNDLVLWAAGAVDNITQGAVLEYLVDGELGQKLARELQRAMPEWVGSPLDLQTTPLLANWASARVNAVLALLFPPVWQPPTPLPEVPPVDLVRFFAQLHEWWTDQRSDLIRAYEEEVYPAGHPPGGWTIPRGRRDGRDGFCSLRSRRSTRWAALSTDSIGPSSNFA